jgi:hypothetical protein
MPYVYRPYPQAVDFIDKGVIDVYHSNDCFVNSVQVALWQPPGANGGSGSVSYPPDPPVDDYAPNVEQRENMHNGFYASFVNPTEFYVTRGGGRGGSATMSSMYNMAGTGTSDPNDLSGDPPDNPDGSYQQQLLANQASGTTGGATGVGNLKGAKLQPQEMYNYLIGLGVKDEQAKALVANAARESGLNPCENTGDGGTSAGLFQWHNERKAAMQKYCPDWCTSWQCQIQYALYGEPRSLSGYDVGAWLARDMTATEAARQWIYGWERPADPRGGQAKNVEYLRQFFGTG